MHNPIQQWWVMTLSRSVDESYKLARTTDPVTSHEAANDVINKAAKHQRLVLKAFHDAKRPLTDIELERILFPFGVSPQSARSRRKELQCKGLIYCVGKTDPSQGRRRQIWALSEWEATS